MSGGLGGSGAVVDAVCTRLSCGVGKVSDDKSAFESASGAIAGRFLGADHDFENVAGMFGGHEERRLELYAVHQMPEAVGPRPIRMRFLVVLPAAS